MAKGKVIFLYSTSGLSEKPFLDAGYECWSFDGQNKHEDLCVGAGWHKRYAWFDPEDLDRQAEGIIEKVLGGGNDCPIVLVFGFPECTNIAVSGSRHFAKKLAEDPEIQNNAAKLARLVEVVGNKANCPWAAENPVSVLATLWRKPDVYFEPYEYGGYLPETDTHPLYPEFINARDAYPKKTCLWTGNGFVMPPKRSVPVPLNADGSVEYSPQYKKLGGKSLKTKNIRSASPRGFFVALCQQLQGC